MRILVTGGTGFVGKHLIPLLLEQNLEVVLLVRERYGMGHPLPPELARLRQRLALVFADLRNPRMTRRAVAEAQPDTVLHLAAVGVSDPFLSIDSALRHNLYGTINLARACFNAALEQHPTRFVVARTPGERDAMNVYATSKAAAWQFCRMFARTRCWPISGAMIFQAYGSGQSDQSLVPAALAAAMAGRDFPMTAGTQTRDWIYVADVVRGLIQTMNCELPPGSTVELGTGALNTVLEVVELIYRLVDRGGRPLPGRLPQRPGEVTVQTADVQSSANLLGWKAITPLEVGLQHLIREQQQA